MHKLTSTEAQRVMAVLGECQDRLLYVSLLPERHSKDVVEKLDDNRCFDAAESLLKMWRNEEDLEGSTGRPVFSNSLAEEDAKLSIRAICRVLRDNKTARDAIKKVRKDKVGEGMTSFSSVFAQMAEHTYRKLCTTVEDEHSKKARLTELIERANTAEENRIALESQIKQLRQERASEVTKLQTMVTKLTKEVETIKANALQDATIIEAAEKERREKATASHTQEMADLGKEHGALRESTSKDVTSNREEEETLRKKKVKLELELQSWIDKYDKDMSELAERIANCEKELKQEKEEREELEGHFAMVDAEDLRIAKEEAFYEMLRDREREKRRILEKAACHIQRLYRGYRVRKELKNQKKSSKKGKKSKK